MSGMHAQAARLAGAGVPTTPTTRQTFRGAYLAALLLAALVLFVSSSAAQVRTAVRDVLYNADGSRASGQIEITWNSFAAADGKTIAAGKITRRITDGVLDVSLVPTEGATPAGASYAVSYVLSSGISYSETWSVPASGPVRLSAVRLLPPIHLPAETVSPESTQPGIRPLGSSRPRPFQHGIRAGAQHVRPVLLGHDARSDALRAIRPYLCDCIRWVGRDHLGLDNRAVGEPGGPGNRT